MDFTSKVVIITGASSGIGAAAAISFAKQSAKLVLVGRNETNLNQTALKCEQFKNIKPLIVIADITVDEDVKNIIEKTIETFGCIDVLVNNVGVGIHGSILEGVELYDKAMNVNVRATYLMTSLAAPYLIKSKGNVVNVSSIASLKPIKDFNFLPYCVSKAALDQFTKCVALELASKGVRVNSVNPGCTRTKFIETAGFAVNNEALDRRGAEFPLGKIVESEEVADLILYLCLNHEFCLHYLASDYVTYLYDKPYSASGGYVGNKIWYYENSTFRYVKYLSKVIR